MMTKHHIQARRSNTDLLDRCSRDTEVHGHVEIPSSTGVRQFPRRGH